MKTLMLTAIIFLTACQEPANIRSKEEQRHRDLMYSKWHQHQMEYCKQGTEQLVSAIVLSKYETNKDFRYTEADIKSLHRFILETCYKHEGLTI